MDNHPRQCPRCQSYIIRAKIEYRQIDDYVREHGIKCPNCGKWNRTHWTNTTLDKLHFEGVVNKSRQSVRKYRREFKKFQGLMQKRERANNVPA